MCCVTCGGWSSTHRGDVLGGKLVGGVGDEQAGFPHGAVAHHNTLYSLHLRPPDTREEEEEEMLG